LITTATCISIGSSANEWSIPSSAVAILGLILEERNIDHIIEESANGHAVLQDLRREPRALGARLRGIRVKEGKIARVFSWNALAEEGRLYLIRGRWNEEFIEEACSFPNGTHDDQIDAVSLAVKQHFLARSGATFHAF
jgi:predicted phage terminase large subunit-like protein